MEPRRAPQVHFGGWRWSRDGGSLSRDGSARPAAAPPILPLVIRRALGYRSCAAPCCQPLTAPTRGEEHAMDETTDVSEPASELEHLIADLSGSGPLVFVFGDGFTTAHLVGVTTPLFRGPADRRWWHVEIGDDAASWTMDVRVDEITGVTALAI